jgi:poly-gamma-glutamate capsule biosynthesis protein CapA/YwtB (metallophosphatase superfamily)
MIKKYKILIFLIIILIILGIIFFQRLFINKNIEIDSPSIDMIIQAPPEIKETKLFFVGDMMLDRGVENSVIKNFDGNYHKLFENLSYLKEADILFANLEGPISDKGNNVGSKYSFRMDPKVLPAIADAGFTIVSFSNNHVGDWNVKAFLDTLSNLSDFNILLTGAGINKIEAEKPTIIIRNDTIFGFLAFSDVGPNWLEAKEDKPGILIASDPNLEEIIKKAKETVDVLIVSFHFGEEYKTIHNQRQENLAHKSIDAGADLIIGHHPHVIQDIEIYKDKPIVYSLGNFIFDQYFSEATMEGMLFEAIYIGKDLIEINQKKIMLDRNYQPKGIF